MSGYVEASYALVVLNQAHTETASAAGELIVDLLRDLSRSPNTEMARTDAVSAICALSEPLRCHRMPQEPAWRAAIEAATNWRERG